MKRLGIQVTRHPRLDTGHTKGPRVWTILVRIGKRVTLA